MDPLKHKIVKDLIEGIDDNNLLNKEYLLNRIVIDNIKKTYIDQIINKNEIHFYSKYGVIYAETPKQASNKIFIIMAKQNNIELDKPYYFYFYDSVECKKYTYTGERNVLETPITINVNGKEIMYIFSNKVVPTKLIYNNL